ncbi:hypothetical protein ABH15_11570 [Methanoculleus taiwanensis]|uniref:DNA-binding protein n=1 Tax=Methanoculleus taiwanensis TaxID=1550565 RepID=A0A498GZW7_9EURY|nr:hypothetical protein [Methanoculleus taiwanensis]RXE55380.1 hypothetical protein ABH15_11570 [Methanoculleus taiwanensis]
MESAVRVFARDFNASRYTVDGDEPGSPCYLVTPGGAWCRRIFIVGALTERKGSGDVMHARLADPTGAFSLTTGRQSPDVAATLGYIDPPAFVAVTGQASLMGSGSRTRALVTPETLTVVDRTVRDLWVLRTAERTLERLEMMQAVIRGTDRDDRLETALRLYGSGTTLVAEQAAMVRAALASVRPDITVGEVAPRTAAEVVTEILEAGSGPRGLSRSDAIARAVMAGLSASAAGEAIDALLAEGECYSPSPGMIRRI